MAKAQFFQYTAHRDVSRSVQRCIDYADIIRHFPDRLWMNDLFLEFLHIPVIHRFTDHMIQSLIHRSLFVHSLYFPKVCDAVHLGYDLKVLWRCNLSAVFPVYLIAVIFRRVVAGRYHDAGNTFQLS